MERRAVLGPERDPSAMLPGASAPTEAPCAACDNVTAPIVKPVYNVSPTRQTRTIAAR
jgi:hypothetical protein